MASIASVILCQLNSFILRVFVQFVRYRHFKNRILNHRTAPVQSTAMLHFAFFQFSGSFPFCWTSLKFFFHSFIFWFLYYPVSGWVGSDEHSLCLTLPERPLNESNHLFLRMANEFPFNSVPIEVENLGLP